VFFDSCWYVPFLSRGQVEPFGEKNVPRIVEDNDKSDVQLLERGCRKFGLDVGRTFGFHVPVCLIPGAVFAGCVVEGVEFVRERAMGPLEILSREFVLKIGKAAHQDGSREEVEARRQAERGQ